MSDRPPAAELRRSVAVLATEWWLAAGGLAGYLCYGLWVVGTGLALGALPPGLAATTVTTVGSTPVTGLVVFAAVAWLLAPAAAAAWLLDRQLSNVNGNLVSQYRIDHPGVLPAPSGVLMLVVAAVAVAVGPRPPVLAVMAVAGVHLLVRTIAFGRRVYSVSPKPLFSVLSGVSGLALAAAWLVHAPGLPGTVGEQAAAAGVGSVVETGLGLAGVGSGTALGVLVAVPALLSGLYLVVQTVVARRVRAQAPLANPVKRAEQRYPIMPPVADSSRPGPPSPNGSSQSAASTASSESESPDERATDDAGDTTGDTDDASEVTTDDSSHTRVFTTDEPIPDGDDATATVAGDAQEDEEDDGWIDDTAIFSPEGASSSDDECGACGEEIPRESVTFCPNCGERIRR
ncbi:zinc ribbon domain-containing protein [Haloarcula onubensis]|uniref:Zinc ribbon domain-containing protein n=1 Tax=Haloarcula onubensis TaxID=2950539 RepID=A0ABU2FRR9_9EURY|nr:zinc ribbon domain-containing protein [Halomicroarcula sp. S3CR25-11]MDS0282846.1 zinc ribbon domain-containing protein [Halomicroarcula sp. S3CR25-11]